MEGEGTERERERENENNKQTQRGRAAERSNTQRNCRNKKRISEKEGNVKADIQINGQ